MHVIIEVIRQFQRLWAGWLVIYNATERYRYDIEIQIIMSLINLLMNKIHGYWFTNRTN